MSTLSDNMVVDVHTHPFESLKVFPQRWLDGFFRLKRITFGDEFTEKLRATMDGSVEALIRDMDEAGVDKCVVSHLDYSTFCQQEPEMSVWRANEYMAEMQAKYPNRIIAFVGIDPLRKDAVELLEKGVTEWKLQGVKVILNYSVLDESVQTFMEKLNELEVPVLFHQGTSPAPYAAKYGNPAELDLLTLKYTKMKVIAAHCAKGYGDLLLAIIKYRAGSIFTDISSLQYDYFQSPWHFIMEMRLMMDKIPNSVLLGSDWPLIIQPPHPTYKQWVDAIRNLKIPNQVLQLGLGIKDFSQEEKEKILGKNAKRLLKI